MNQILVTERIYVTPELKRKKQIYNILFITSILLLISLLLIYIYTEYDRNKDESVSDDILSFIFFFVSNSVVLLYILFL